MRSFKELAEKRELDRYATPLTWAVAVALLLVLPYTLDITSQLRDGRRTNPYSLAIGLLVQLAVSYGIIRLGLRLGRQTGLGWLPLDGWDGKTLERERARRALVVATLLGVAAALILAIAGELLRDMWPMRPIRNPPWWSATLASLGAGIHEEVMFRLGTMTLFAWLGMRLTRATAPGPAIIWTANVLAALLFGAAHLPQAGGLAPLTGSLVAFVLAANGLVGVVCGWLFWRKGLVAAMVAHAVVDLVTKVFLPLLGVGDG